MKKRIYWIMTILALAFIFTGCGGGGNGSNGGYESYGATIFEKGITDLEVNQGTGPSELTYSFSATDPAADTYTLYYAEGNHNTAASVRASGLSIEVEPASVHEPEVITGLKDAALYSIVVVASLDNEEIVSSITKAGTIGYVWGIYTSVNIEEAGLDTVVTWSFENELGVPVSPESGITLTYNYSGLAIVGGKLTTSQISGTETISLASNVREYTIVSGDLIVLTDIVVSILDGEVTSTAQNTKPIELRLYNVAYAKSREYGAIEMFSYGRAQATASVQVQARGHTIVNYQNSNPVNLYGATFSKGHGGILGMGTADATQLREWYYDGEYLYGRTAGGNTGWASGSNDSAPAVPGTSGSQNWNNVNSVAHALIWTAFHTRFSEGPFNYIPYDINNGYTGLYQYMYANPTTITNAENMAGGRLDSPLGLFQTSTRGALSHTNGMFQFSLLMNGNNTGNRVNIQWSGDVTMTAGYAHCSITFVIDENFRFVKYHAYDQYNVTLLTARTNVATTMYFVYHEDNIDFSSHATFRPHHLRPNHVNYFDGDASDREAFISSGTDMIIASSRYPLNLGWTASANPASKIHISGP